MVSTQFKRLIEQNIPATFLPGSARVQQINFKKLHAHDLAYMHMMSMMKYMHKLLCCVPGGVIPCNIPASISSLHRAPLNVPGNASSSALWDWDSTFSLCWGWVDSWSVFLSSSLSTTFSFSLSLLDTHLKFYFLSWCCAHQLTLWNKWFRLCLLRRARAFAHHRASKSLSVRAIYRASRQIVPKSFQTQIKWIGNTAIVNILTHK